jgi:hypothetical protein
MYASLCSSSYDVQYEFGPLKATVAGHAAQSVTAEHISRTCSSSYDL